MVGIWEKHPKFLGHSPFRHSLVLLPCIRELIEMTEILQTSWRRTGGSPVP